MVHEAERGELLLLADHPVLLGLQELLAADEALEARVMGEEEQVAQFGAKAEDPEAGVDEAQQAQGGQADPVGRNKHAPRSVVEGGGDVLFQAEVHTSSRSKRRSVNKAIYIHVSTTPLAGGASGPRNYRYALTPVRRTPKEWRTWMRSRGSILQPGGRPR